MDTLSLTYIYHDGFWLESAEAVVLFDYWKDPCGVLEHKLRELEARHDERPLYVVVSHHHKDHYNPDIFLLGSRPRVHYILSGDTARMARPYLTPDSLYKGPRRVSPDKVTVLNPGECFTAGDVTVRAYDSTDTGNSYVVTLGGTHVFHAGDLNAWVWKDESTPQEVEDAISGFGAVLERIATDYPRLHLAMMPVDPRMGTDYWVGAGMLVHRIAVDCFVPMHFALADTEAERAGFILRASDFAAYRASRGVYASLTSPGATLSLAAPTEI